MLVNAIKIENHKKGHPYHLVDVSPWPIITSGSLLVLTSGAAMYFNGYLYGEWILLFGLLICLSSAFIWWRDVIRESTYQGEHTSAVERGLKWGIVLFICSEISLFGSFFWSYGHSSLTPSVELGGIWPPLGIEPLNPWTVPSLNAIILLSSGVSATYSHHSILLGGKKGYFGGVLGLSITLILAIIFTILQGFEFYTSSFTISDSIFGSTFYMTAGMHGLHVIIGGLFIYVCLVRIILGHLTNKHHVGLEGALWYWHTVDFIYLLLYTIFYFWGMGS